MAAGAGTDEVTQRNTLALRDVGYIIEAYPYVYQPTDDNHPTKYISMFNRRVEKGQCFHRPALGCREFAADFGPVTPQDQPLTTVNVDVGLMLYDVVFRKEGNKAVFFKAKVRAGVLDTSLETAIPDETVRREVIACSYRR